MDTCPCAEVQSTAISSFVIHPSVSVIPTWGGPGGDVHDLTVEHDLPGLNWLAGASKEDKEAALKAEQWANDTATPAVPANGKGVPSNGKGVAPHAATHSEAAKPSAAAAPPQTAV